MAKLQIGDEVHVLGIVTHPADSNDQHFCIKFNAEIAMQIPATKIIKHIPKALAVGDKIKFRTSDNFAYDVLWIDKYSVLLRREGLIHPFAMRLCDLNYERV